MDKSEVIQEVRSWIGTPWKHGVALKGFGTDCVQFLLTIAKTAGWVPGDYRIQKYTQDWMLHNNESLLIPELEKYASIVNSMEVCDILAFKYGRCASHVGIYVGEGKMIHAHIRHGVEEDYVKKYKDKLVSVWRIK